MILSDLPSLGPGLDGDDPPAGVEIIDSSARLTVRASSASDSESV